MFIHPINSPEMGEVFSGQQWSKFGTQVEYVVVGGVVEEMQGGLSPLRNDVVNQPMVVSLHGHYMDANIQGLQ